MRKLGFWVCFALWDTGVENTELRRKNIECLSIAPESVSVYGECPSVGPYI